MKNKGFTLIELVVVIVILGIMAAIAVPKFVDLQTEARTSVIQGVEGSLRSAAALVYSKSLIEGEENLNESATPSVTVEGQTVTTHFGYPNAGTAGTPPTGGIMNAVNLQGGNFTVTGDGSAVTISLRANCQVVYTESTGAGNPPDIQPTTTGC